MGSDLSWIQADGLRLERRVLVLQHTGLRGRRQGRPTALTQVLFMSAAFCGRLIAPATIQCVNSKPPVGSSVFGRTGAFPDP